MTLEFVLLALGLIILVKGADFLVSGASSVARKAGISDLSVGLTVVSLGTSTPELLVNVLSATKGYADVAFGNVLGSNNFNTLLVLGLSGAIYPLSIQRSTVRFEMPIFIFATLLLLVLVSDNFFVEGASNVLSRIDASILLAFFFFFLYHVYRTRKINTGLISSTKVYKTSISVFFVVVGLIMLLLGGELAVNNAVYVARRYGISDRIIGVTIMGIGTSLPELVTSMVAVYKRSTGIAIGNIIGSNIFNICLILGLTGLITPMPYNSEINFDVYVAIASSCLLLVFMFTLKKDKLDRYEAIFLLLGYIVYAFALVYREFA